MPGFHKATENQGTKLLKALSEAGLYIFDMEKARQIAQQIEISSSYLKELLSRLEERKWIIRLHRGLYATTGGLPGSIQLHPFVIATHLVEPSAISHLSALSFHGLTEQMPHVVTVTTTSSFVTPSMRTGEKEGSRHRWEVQGVSCEFVKVKKDFFFGIEKVWIDQQFRIAITDKERTILDGCIYPQMFGGLGEVIGFIKDNLYQLDTKQLVNYALKYKKETIIKRLGWILDNLNVEEALLEPLQQVPISSYRPLDPAAPKQGKHDRKWMIINNLW